MLISLILAWAAVVFTVLAAVKYPARKLGAKKLNAHLSKKHILTGTLLIAAGLLHGLFAGNFSGATLSDMTLAPVLFTWNWGTACFAAAVLLGLTYVFRKKLKRLWMPLHRILTAVLLVLVLIHVLNVGVSLDDRIKAFFTQSSAASSYAESQAGTQSSAAESSYAASPEKSSAQSASVSSGTSSSGLSAVSGSIVSQSQTLFSGAVLNDGTYQGSAAGYRGTITVAVTVSGGKVSAINIVSENDTPQYFNRAAALTDTIVSAQSLEVDAVTGATFSSAGIINAVADALQSAVKSGTLAVADINTSGGGRR